MTTKEATTTQCESCDVMIDGYDVQGILVEEGGDIPAFAVCGQCLTTIEETDPDRAAYLIDCADIASLHVCVEHARPAVGSTPDNRWADCDMCGVVLENSGDAYVLPSD